MSIGAAVANVVDSVKAQPSIKVDDDLLALSKQVGKEVTDDEYIIEQAKRINNKATLFRDGSLRSPGQKGRLGVAKLRELKAAGDKRGLADALRNVSDYQFTKDGSGLGGTGTLVEALTKPGWKHSGRDVKVVMMKPTEYLARSAKGHGMSYEELLAQVAQGERTDDILNGMLEGKQFSMPYFDYRGGSFGQEGQHRAHAAAILGMDEIPVAVMWDDAAKNFNTSKGKPGFRDPRGLEEGKERLNKVQKVLDDELEREGYGRGLNAADVEESKVFRDFPQDSKFELNGEEYTVVRHRTTNGEPAILAQKKGARDNESFSIDELREAKIPETLSEDRLAKIEKSGFNSREKVYHVTTTDVGFEAKEGFRPFSHFGTKKAAEDRFETVRPQPFPTEFSRNKASPRTIPVHLKVDRPLRVDDNGLSDANSHAQAIVAGLMDKGEGDDILEAFVKKFQSKRNEQDRFEVLTELMDELGYDGLTYVNKVEDTGSVSVVPVRANQIRSPNAKFEDLKSGNIMAGAAGGAVGLSETNEAQAGTQGTPTDSVDWSFIEDREGFETDLYVPNPDGSKSGATLGMGIDLGAWGEADLKKLGVPDETLKKLKPYFGKKGRAAADFVKANPLSLTKEEARDVSVRVKRKILDTIKSKFDKDSKVPFDQLTPGQQTAVASVFFQYGTNPKKGWPHNYWKQVTSGDWVAAKKNLENFGDDYSTRRKKEAKLL